ncbi:MAG: Sec-independent protein translocase protein TatB [Pseudomonadota bacterium]
MLDIGWQELLVIGALALIVVGPKDLPGLLRSLGQWVGRMRGMAREFQSAMNDAARQADVGGLKEFKDQMSSTMDFKSQAMKAQTYLNDTVGDLTDDNDLPPEKKAAPVKDETESSMVSQSAPVDKPDPAAMGDAMPKPEALVEEVAEAPAKVEAKAPTT